MASSALEGPHVSHGAWMVEGLPTGPHTLDFERPEFGLVRQLDSAADSAGITAVLPEISTARVTGVSATVDHECGTDPCLSLPLQVAAEGLLPPGGSRRAFRAFMGTTGEVTRLEHDQTISFLVTEDSPELTVEGETATIALAPFHGLDLTAVDGETVSVLVLGGTENTFFRDGESDAPSALYPDLAPEGAVAVVEQ